MMGELESKSEFLGRVDFHTHILPGVDDGSRSLEGSIQMLRALAESEVGCVALTPHFYARRDNPERFISRRNRAMSELCEALAAVSDMPRVHLVPGAEIEYFDGVSCLADYPELKLGKSQCLLIEMLPDIWTARMIDELIELNGRGDCRVVIAHVERYLFNQKRGVIYELLENGIVMQSNAEFFIDRRTSGKAIKLLRKGYIHVLGSDCHNLTDRAPNIGTACDIIKSKLGEDMLDYMMNKAASLLARDIQSFYDTKEG